MMCLSVLSVCHRLLMEARGWLVLWKLVLLPSTMWFLGIRLKYGQALYPLKHLAGYASGFNPPVSVSCVPGLSVWAARPAFYLCMFLVLCWTSVKRWISFLLLCLQKSTSFFALGAYYGSDFSTQERGCMGTSAVVVVLCRMASSSSSLL